jgi:hypothetical protein
MSTLTTQPPREFQRIEMSELETFIKEVINVAKNQKVDLPLVLEAYKILEIKRRNDLYVRNGDAFDEQMAGFGELFEMLNHRLDGIALSIENKQ